MLKDSELADLKDMARAGPVFWGDVAQLIGRLASAEAALLRLHALVDELLTAIERAEQDIGGSRSSKEIIADFGPASEAARAHFDKTRG